MINNSIYGKIIGNKSVVCPVVTRTMVVTPRSHESDLELISN